MTRKNLSRRALIRLVALFAFFSISLTVYSVAITKKASRLQLAVDISDQRAANELCESIDNITVLLEKCLYSGTKDMLREQGNQLCRTAAVAKENLSLLTDEDSQTREIYRFLSQVGNYTIALSSSEGDSLAEKDTRNLIALYKYASALNKAVSELLGDFSDGTVSFSNEKSTLIPEEAELPEDFYSRISDVEQTLTDYPTLLYDGPFSESRTDGKYTLLSDKNEITADEARQKAAELLGASPAALRKEDDIASDIELYCFSLEGSFVTVTKKGGYIHSFIKSVTASAATISPEGATERGKAFLRELGYDNMTESYYTVYDGICTVNYASRQQGTVCYSDLIKVSISLDKGEAVALDASAYLSSYHKRKLPSDIISRSEAMRTLSRSLEIISCKKVLIPTESDTEVLCYEFHCRYGSAREALVYIDCTSGKEQDIMLLLYSDDGILTR